MAVIVVSRAFMDLLDRDTAQQVTQTHRWLVGILVLYLVNFIVAWRYSGFWRISMIRMLIFGVIAYLCISHIVDILGKNDALARQILGLDTLENTPVVVALRMRIAAWIAGCGSSLMCIGVGFEKNGV